MKKIELNDDQQKSLMRCVDAHLKNMNIKYWNMCIRSDSGTTGIFIFHDDDHINEKTKEEKSYERIGKIKESKNKKSGTGAELL